MKMQSIFLSSEGKSSEKEPAACEAGTSAEGTAEDEVPKPQR